MFPNLSDSEILHIAELSRREPNPHDGTAKRQIQEIINSLKLDIPVELFEDYEMSAYLWPYTNLERLRMLRYFFSAAFLVDDVLGNDTYPLGRADGLNPAKVIGKKAADILLNGFTPQEPDSFDKIFIYLRRQIVYLSSPSSKEASKFADGFSPMLVQEYLKTFAGRFFTVTIDHMAAGVTDYDFDPETGVRSGYKGSVEDFIQTRRRSSGMYPTVMSIEFANNQYLPIGIMEQLPLLNKLTELVIDIGGLSNELFSYQKEVLCEHPTTFNLVSVIQREEETSAENAAHIAVDIVNDRYAEFKVVAADLEKELPDLNDKAIENYVSGLWDIVAASYHFQAETTRYRYGDSVFARQHREEL